MSCSSCASLPSSQNPNRCPRWNNGCTIQLTEDLSQTRRQSTHLLTHQTNMSLVKIPNPNPSTVQTLFVHGAPPVAMLIVGSDSIVLGPPQMSFASSLHSPPLRKTSNKDGSL